MIDPDSRRISAATGISLAVHGGAAFALFVGFAGAPAALPPAAMVIDMAPLPSAPPSPADAPPQVEQEEAKPKPVVTKIKLPPIPKLAFNVKPEVAVPLKELVDPNKKQAEKPAEQTTHAAAPQADIKDAPKAPAMGQPSNSNSNARQDWEALVLASLQRNIRFPAAAQSAGQQDIVRVVISIDRSGRVTDVRIKSSRGYPLVDAAAIATVRRASPLPKPPETVAGDPVVKEVPLVFAVKRKG